VLILTVSASSNFKSDDHPTFMEMPLMRTLATTNYNYTDFMKSTRLEQPNILGGVAAGSINLFMCPLRNNLNVKKKLLQY